MHPTSLTSQPHNQQHCTNTALMTANRLCSERGVKLTPQREQVLRLILQSRQPVGAYQLMAMLEELSDKTIAPPTVYRALHFLVEQDLVHKLHSINAFVGCNHPSGHHQSHFLICSHCQTATEFDDHSLNQAITHSAQARRFVAKEQFIEIFGLCPDCQTNTSHQTNA
ncbi:Fur family transcriptional regulator [Aurantivibrio plasticivorans]